MICKNCYNRTPGCHDHCRAYQTYRNELANKKQWLNEQHALGIPRNWIHYGAFCKQVTNKGGKAMKQWAKACAVCNAYKIQDCGICINQPACNDNKTGYCFLCADAMICCEREAAGMTYNADLKAWEGAKTNE